MSEILDAGALIALEKNDRRMWRHLNDALQTETPPKTHGGVIAQVWRGGAGLQARLAAGLQAVEIIPLDARLGRRAGVLLARCGLSDAIDAALVAMAEPGDRILTSDPNDLAVLAAAAELRVEVVPV